MKFLGLELDISKLSIRNALGTFKSTFTNLATANRTVTIPDRDFTIAGTDQLVDATDSNAGFINTTTQNFSGDKSFLGSVDLGVVANNGHNNISGNLLEVGSDANGTLTRTSGVDKYLAMVLTPLAVGQFPSTIYYAYRGSGYNHIVFGGANGDQYAVLNTYFYNASTDAQASGTLTVSFNHSGLTIAPNKRLILSTSDMSTLVRGSFDFDASNELYFTRNLTREKIAFKGDITYPTSTATSINLGTVLGTNLALTVPAGLGFIAGDNYRIYSAANTANFIECSFVSYTSNTLTVLVEFARGTATFTDGILIRSSNTFSTYLSADKAVSVTTATGVDEFKFHAEAGVLYNVKVTGSFSADASTTGGYIGTTSSIVPAILTGKCYVGILQTVTSTELVTSMSTTVRSIVGSGNSGADIPCAIGMDFNVRFTSNSNSFINFASEVAGSVATLLTGSSITVTRIR